MFSRFPDANRKNVGAGLVPARFPLARNTGRDKPCPYILIILFAAFLLSCAGKGEQKQTAQALSSSPAPQPRQHLRVCADPNNLPFSNERLEGFENKIAALIAHEMNTDVQYTW